MIIFKQKKGNYENVQTIKNHTQNHKFQFRKYAYKLKTQCFPLFYKATLFASTIKIIQIYSNILTKFKKFLFVMDMLVKI